MPQLNKPLLRKIKVHIKKEPKRLCMGWWVQKRGENQFQSKVRDDATWASDKLRNYDFPRCGTAACIGGWAVLLSGKNPDDYVVSHKAQELLGLTHKQSENLFAVSSWPQKFAIAYETARSHKAKVAATISRLNYLLRYGK